MMYNHPMHKNREKYDDNGKGCIIFIANTVEMSQSYTVANYGASDTVDVITIGDMAVLFALRHL